MANNWKGYLFTIPGQTEAEEKRNAFPLKYIAADSWTSAPNYREEIKAFRDDNTRDLTRVTAAGMKSSFSFKTIEGISLDEKIAILKWFTDHESDTKQRKITIKFWQDDVSEYKTATFYRSNTTFKIQGLSETDIRYGSADFSLIEY